MKRYFLFSALLLLLAPFCTQAQDEMVFEIFTNEVSCINVTDNADVTLRFTNEPHNTIQSPSDANANNGAIKYKDGTMTVDGLRQVTLCINPSILTTIKLSANGKMTIHAAHDTLRSLTIKCMDNSRLYINGTALTLNSLRFEAEDNSHISVKAPCHANILLGSTESLANVAFSNISGDSLYANSCDNSVINILDGHWNTAMVELADLGRVELSCDTERKTFKYYQKDANSKRSTSSTDGVFDDEFVEVVLVDDNDFSPAPYYRMPPLTQLTFLLGFHNWAEKQGNFCIAENNGYQIDTRLGAFQAELNFNLLRSKRIWMGLGVGYSRNRYRFSTQNPLNMYPELTDLDVYSNTSHYLTTHFITVPVHLTLRLHKSLQIGVAAVPGFNPRYRNDIFLAENNSYNQQNVLYTHHDLLNPYRCDLRLTLGSPHWGAYLQMATTPLFNRTNTKIYPIEAGLILHIF